MMTKNIDWADRWIDNWIDEWVLSRVLEKECIKDDISLPEERLDDLRRLNTLGALLPFENDTFYPVSTFKCMWSPQVVHNHDIRHILSKIRTGGEHKDLILEARIAGKPSPRYDEIKALLPTFTPNGTFNGSRNSENLEELSGLLYLDIDGFTEINLENPLIYASWRSFGNTGRGILVKVNGMTAENIKEVYKEISHELNIQDWVDNNCREISRQNVISYDPDLYVNKESSVFTYKTVLKTPNSPTLKKKKERNAESLVENRNDRKIRWNNLEDHDLQGKSYEYFPEKKMFVKVYFPLKKIEAGSRNQVISAIINNFLYLNPFSSKENTHRFILALNERCIKPLEEKELVRIYTRKLKELETGKLEPIENFERSFIFSREVSKEERSKIVGFHLGKNRSEETRRLIQECLENWDLNDGKITNIKIAAAIERCVNTVSNHMKTFKPMKDELNAAIKEEKKKNRKKGDQENTSEGK